jgi:hypothetical protein
LHCLLEVLQQVRWCPVGGGASQAYDHKRYEADLYVAPPQSLSILQFPHSDWSTNE